jgi:AhpD family alkylhydroperoxidase
MSIKEQNKKRIALNTQLCETDEFFRTFGLLDDSVYADGAIPKKYKELTGLSISVLSRCDECILYHLQECIKQNATKTQIIEAIKMGVIGGGSITYPNARYAL